MTVGHSSGGYEPKSPYRTRKILTAAQGVCGLGMSWIGIISALRGGELGIAIAVCGALLAVTAVATYVTLHRQSRAK